MNPSPQMDFALKGIALGRAALATDPRTGIFQIYTGHLLLARQALASSDAECYEMLRRAADIVRTGFSKYHVAPAPERQNDCIIFAAAAGDLPCATELAAIEPDYSASHDFDVALSRTLRSLLSGSEPPSTIYRPTAAETGLFEALSSIGTNTFSTTGTERYWRATRHKRYQNTIHDQKDFFSPAIQKLHEVAS